ncbi:2OG-Fe(II) oxygenase [Zobellella maritima]|uniref:2OG-Fe(II) oxygenase n=1 Tax=Zobellella maritima TaxID=2059725 RepID=UPI000E3017F2|nr:2OG-Fe(II) oxygenase [Zobellella maritima]
MSLSCPALPIRTSLDALVDAIAEQGIGIFPDFFAPSLIDALRDDVHALPQHRLSQAGIGRELAHHTNSRIRTDKTCWINGHSRPQQDYLALMAEIQQQMNRQLFMGLQDYECHYARYQAGDFYKKHLDAFRGRSNRRLTTVAYLNPEWQAQDGGELLVYDPQGRHPILQVLPQAGTLVCFLSERFPHEVLPARRTRLSIAGWFRVDGPLG